jgi:hypothetical protein
MAMTVWPTDQAPGNVSSEPAWRKMAKLWAPDGVAWMTLNQMAPTLVAGPAIRVDTGAVWIDGHYAENPTAATIAAVGDGLLVVRFEPATGIAELVFRAGATVPTKLLATWEVPIAAIVAGALSDRRAFTPVGGELAHAETASTITLTSGWTAILTFPPIPSNGLDVLEFEFNTPRVNVGGTGYTAFNLFTDGAQGPSMAYVLPTSGAPIGGRLRQAPSAGLHTYSLRGLFVAPATSATIEAPLFTVRRVRGA